MMNETKRWRIYLRRNPKGERVVLEVVAGTAAKARTNAVRRAFGSHPPADLLVEAELAAVENTED